MCERAMIDTFVDCSAEYKDKIIVSRDWVTTLADFARVSDDHRLFRAQFEVGKAGGTWAGLHGSFFIIAICV